MALTKLKKFLEEASAGLDGSHGMIALRELLTTNPNVTVAQFVGKE